MSLNSIKPQYYFLPILSALFLCFSASFTLTSHSYAEEISASRPATMPKMLETPQPKYPKAEKLSGIEGKCQFRLLVGKNGKVKKATLLTSTGNENLDTAALKAVKKWRFQPPLDNEGQPVQFYFIANVWFRLK